MAAINTNSLSISERLCRLLPLSSSSIFSSLFYDSFAFTFNCLSIKVQGAKNWHFIVHHDSNDQIYTYILYYQDWFSNISFSLIQNSKGAFAFFPSFFFELQKERERKKMPTKKFSLFPFFSQSFPISFPRFEMFVSDKRYFFSLLGILSQGGCQGR